jgi:hypothetical protein
VNSKGELSQVYERSVRVASDSNYFVVEQLRDVCKNFVLHEDFAAVLGGGDAYKSS